MYWAVLWESAAHRQLKTDLAHFFPQTLALYLAQIFMLRCGKFSVSWPVGKATAIRDQMLHNHIAEHSIHIPEQLSMQPLS